MEPSVIPDIIAQKTRTDTYGNFLHSPNIVCRIFLHFQVIIYARSPFVKSHNAGIKTDVINFTLHKITYFV